MYIHFDKLKPKTAQEEKQSLADLFETDRNECKFFPLHLSNIPKSKLIVK